MANVLLFAATDQVPLLCDWTSQSLSGFEITCLVSAEIQKTPRPRQPQSVFFPLRCPATARHRQESTLVSWA